MQKRLLSVVLGVPLILAAVYAGGVCYTVLLLLVVLLGMREYLHLVGTGMENVPACGIAGVFLLLLLAHFRLDGLFFPLLLLMFFLLFTRLLSSPKTATLKESALVLWGIIYLGGCGSYLILMRALPGGMLLTIIFMVGVWINDILAFCIGVRWGRRKFVSRISPNKSVEGFLAGFIGTPVAATAAAFLLPGGLAGLGPVCAALLGLLIALGATYGDLLESALKRQSGVKDTGQLIPGHGGILDRFDSLLAAAPFVYYFFLLFHGGF